MSKWHKKTKTQLFFAQQGLERYKRELEQVFSPAVLKQIANACALSVREAWICWLNELAELMSPKQSVPVFHNLSALISHFGDSSPEVSRLRNNIESVDSWVSGFVELEQLICPEIEVTVVDLEGGQPELESNLIFKQTEPKTLSINNGMSDLEKMLAALKEEVRVVREQHLEW